MDKRWTSDRQAMDNRARAKLVELVLLELELRSRDLEDLHWFEEGSSMAGLAQRRQPGKRDPARVGQCSITPEYA